MINQYHSQNLTIRFSRFWDGFNPNDNFITQLLEQSGISVSVISNKRKICDIEFVSVFPNQNARIMSLLQRAFRHLSVANPSIDNLYQLGQKQKKFKADRLIWVTGENIRPPANQSYDGFLSFDQALIKNNAYLPLWYFEAGLFKNNYVHRVGVNCSVNNLTQPRNITELPMKFACGFIGNLHPMRMHFVNVLKSYGVVDLFGHAYSKPVKHKFPIAKDYRFTISFENDFYPGYVTEKILEAYLCQSVPIYWGNLGANSPINEEAIIQKQDNQSLENLAKEVSEMTNEQVLFKLNQPLLKFVPETQNILGLILGRDPD